MAARTPKPKPRREHGDDGIHWDNVNKCYQGTISLGYDDAGKRLRRTVRGKTKAEVKEKVDNLLEVVGLAGFQSRYPNQLSGGQRQRMALARALAVDPQVLLLDEPFGALDAKVREDLRVWLRRLHDEVHVTTVLVTHDQAEALDVADRIAVLNKGRIEQVGSPT